MLGLQQSPRRATGSSTPVDPSKAFILNLPDELVLHILSQFEPWPWVQISRTRRTLVSLASTCRRLRPLVYEVLHSRCSLGIYGQAKLVQRQDKVRRWLRTIEGRWAVDGQPSISTFIKDLSLDGFALDKQTLRRIPGALQACSNLTVFDFDWRMSGVDLLNALPPTLEELRVSHVDFSSDVDEAMMKIKARPTSVDFTFDGPREATMGPGTWAIWSPACGPSPPPSKYLESLLRHLATSGRLRTLYLRWIPPNVPTEVLLDDLASAAESLRSLTLHFPRYRYGPPPPLALSTISSLHRLESFLLINAQADVSTSSLLALPLTLRSLGFSDCPGVNVPSAFQAYLSSPRSASLDTLRIILRELVGPAWDGVKEEMARRRLHGRIFSSARAESGDDVAEVISAISDLNILGDL